MMFSAEKCAGHSGSGVKDEAEIFAGGGDGPHHEGVPADEVASAVAAVSDEIGDILKDELGDAARAERIGAELADLSAELGLLAGLAAHEPQPDFPAFLEHTSGALAHRGSGSGSSSSSSSSGRASRSRRPPRPLRAARRKPIAKGKELSRRLSRRAVLSMRVRREPASDASDVGADSDSADQWTELDTASGSSDSSSVKDGAEACAVFDHKEAEAPPMGQFLLPLLGGDLGAADQEHFLIRHEDILQLLASAEDVRDDVADGEEAAVDDNVSGAEGAAEEAPVTPEEEAALLHYICESERLAKEESSPAEFKPVEEWLLGVYHSWCEISALMYTMIGTTMSVEMENEEWLYRARFPCHCRLCLCLCDSEAAVTRLVRRTVAALAQEGSCVREAVLLMRALRLKTAADAPLLQHSGALSVSPQGAAIIENVLAEFGSSSETAQELVTRVCLCRPSSGDAPQRLLALLANYASVCTLTFKVELVAADGRAGAQLSAAARRLARYLRPYQRARAAARLRDMRARTTPSEVSAWSGHAHRCDCLAPRTLCAAQRKELLRLSFFGMMQVVNELQGSKGGAGAKPSIEAQTETGASELQQGNGTGAKPPDGRSETAVQPSDRADDLSDSNPTIDLDDDAHAARDVPLDGADELSDSNITIDLDDEAHAARDVPLDGADELSDSNITIDLDDEDSETSGSNSLGLSTSSSLDSASELLLAAAAAVESPGEENEAAPGELCRTVRHLMRSIASIERLMDRVLKHCDEWTTHPQRKRVDAGLSEVDRKLMAMYRRLPEVHRRQLQVYRKQKKLSTVCMQLVGGRAPAPPPPGSPPPASPPHVACRALCAEYHLQRFKEVRRKVMHMRDQQLYYHRLRMWLEDQLRQERERCAPEGSASLAGAPASSAAAGKQHKPRLLLALQRKARGLSADYAREVEPPEAFPLETIDNLSDADTVVGERDDMCKEMNECMGKFAKCVLNARDIEASSPPLQLSSPEFNADKMADFQPVKMAVPEVLQARPLAARAPLQQQVGGHAQGGEGQETPAEAGKDPSKNPIVYKYVTFGLEIKKAMEECQNIINSYHSMKGKPDGVRKDEKGGPMSLEQICEVMMTLDKNSAEFLENMNDDESIDAANTKLDELVENMPQILANMPEIATKLSEFANASFELPEFASIMSSLPEVNSEAQLTPETLKQIRELKLNKTRDGVKVTKNTTKRKTVRKVKNNIDNNDIMGTMTFEFDCKDITELLKDEKELQALMKNQSGNKEDFKDLLFSVSAQVVINKVFEYLKNNKNPELAKCLDGDKDLFTLPKSVNSEMFSKASTLFDNSVKDALSMDELRELVKSRFTYWKHYVTTKFKSIPLELLENEIEAMLEKFYNYVQDLAGKQRDSDSDKIIEKLDKMRYKTSDKDSDGESCPASKDALKQITKLLSTSAGNTFDLIIMKLSKMSKEKQSSVKNLKFKYIDVVRRCAESAQLASWILLDPEIATNVIVEMTGLPPKKSEIKVDLTTNDKKIDYFLQRLREMNTQYMETLPKNALSGDEWLVMLYRLEELENKLKTSLAKVNPPKPPTQTVSETHEAEILAGKGLSKLISKANAKPKKPEPPKPPVKKEEKPAEKEKEPAKAEESPVEKKCKNDAVLAKCEAILTSKGEKTLLDSFYTIKSYITQGLPVPETYKKHVISICSSIDPKLLDEVIEDTLTKKTDSKSQETTDKNSHTDEDSTSSSSKDQNPSALAGSPELLAKYSAQALRKAKQTLNAVAFRKNITRNGQTKSESDACDTPKTDCKWTNDCICDTCKDTDPNGSVCLGDIVKQCYDMEAKSKAELEEKKKEKAKAAVKPVVKAPPKPCDNASHQQHVCKVGHTGGACAADGGAEQPCTCCYCTVFGHAPPLTTPVPRNFNETRERLRSILNKKKLKCKATANGEASPPSPQPAPPPTAPMPTLAPPPEPLSINKPSLVPNPQPLRPFDNTEHRQLAERMARMQVADPTDGKGKVAGRAAPAQHSAPPAERKPLNNEHVREQQQVRQQQAQLQAPQQLQQPRQTQTQARPQTQAQTQTQTQAQAQKPEPIYETPTPIAARPQQIVGRPATAAQPQPAAARPQQAAATPQQTAATPQQTAATPQQIAAAQQQQLQAAQAAIAAQAAQRNRRRQSLSSRDTSVLSTSSGCSGDLSSRLSVSSWRGPYAEDPRDLDALLQYIEGPARHVDRGKKRAKKQRQKNKKLESRLLSERASLQSQLSSLRGALKDKQRAHAHAQGKADGLREQLRALLPAKGRKGKKAKSNPIQQAQAQELAEQLGEYTTVLNIAAKEVQMAAAQVTEQTRRLEHVESQLRAIKEDNYDEPPRPKQPQPQQPQQTQPQPQQQMHNIQQQLLEQQWRIIGERQMNAALINAEGGMVRLRRVDAASVPTEERVKAIPVTPAGAAGAAAAQRRRDAEAERKNTWEQALAHITQLANHKQKKKPKEPAAKPEPQRSQSLTDNAGLSKKQRKALAKQQAEEEEARRKAQEAKAKKAEAKTEAKAETKADKKKEPKKEPAPATKGKEDKQAKKQEVTERRGKENKQEKNAQAPAPAKQARQPQPQQPQTQSQPPSNAAAAASTSAKKKKKKQQGEDGVEHRGPCGADCGKPASCSIMEQLSCGVQVADLRLPPGITLTRVPPTEKKEQVNIKSVPIWKGNQLAAAPTPVARPPPVIAADPAAMMFSTAPAVPPPEPPKSMPMAEPAAAPAGKSKKAKKKAKKAAAQPFATDKKQDGTKMITLRNPMFHPNLPPVQVSPTQQQNKKQDSIRIPDPIPMPPTACQATITPTSNGMFTIRNPLMSMMHQQTLMGVRNPTPPSNPPYAHQGYNYVNPNTYNPAPPIPPQAYVLDGSGTPPKQNVDAKTEYPNSRIMNLASFTQKNEEGYSLFKTNEDQHQKGFLTPENYYVDQGYANPPPKPNVSPNPIGTRPSNESNRSFDSSDSSLFANNPISRPEPIGTPLKREERSEFDLYTPFGSEERNVFRSALFDKGELGSNIGRGDECGPNHMSNGDSLPYFQRLRVGSKLNNEVTIHHVTESKFYKGQECMQPMEPPLDERMYAANSWPHAYGPPVVAPYAGEVLKPPTSLSEGRGAPSPLDEDTGFGAVGSRAPRHALESPGALEAMQRYEQLYGHQQRLHHLDTN